MSQHLTASTANPIPRMSGIQSSQYFCKCKCKCNIYSDNDIFRGGKHINNESYNKTLKSDKYT